MRGYKGMDKDMKCRGMQYEVGKTYHVYGKIELCENGLHFCEKLCDVFDYYGRDGNRFFEVEAKPVDTDGTKSVTNELTVIRELSELEINRCLYGGDGNGDGNGNGYGDGYGYGNGNGNGYGDGDGNGDGYGYGNGNGNGYGDGNGDGKNIQKILEYCA